MVAPVKKEPTVADMSRGIQNATSRFKKQRAGELLQSRLLEESGRGRYGADASNDGAYASNDPEYASRGRRPSLLLDETRLIEAELAQIAEAEGFEREAGDAEMLVKNPPQKPPFPGIMLPIAVLKDVLDGADITGLGIIVTTALSFLISLVLFFWFLGKMSGIQKWLWKRYVFAMAIEFVPLLKIFPATTILVLLAHYRETKIVRLLNSALERIQHGGLPVK